MQQLLAEEVDERKWAFPAFRIPKKDGSIRLVIDFLKLNQMLEQKK
jgi:hypothetical protein